MKLKLDDDGHAVLVDGKPVYVADDGKEFPIDGGQLYGRVRDLTTENAGHRKAKDEAEAKLKPFEGIADPAVALKALETVANIKDGELVAAGKVDEIRAGAKKAAEEASAAALKARDDQIAALTTDNGKLQTQIVGEMIGGAFARSKFVAEKVAVPPPMLEKTYGGNFKIEDGKVVAYDASGTQIFSRVTGESASFDEALEILISADPYKDHILKGQMGAGGGAANGGAAGGAKTLPRSQFEKLPPADQMAKMKEGFTLTEA